LLSRYADIGMNAILIIIYTYIGRFCKKIILNKKGGIFNPPLLGKNCQQFIVLWKF
jgi:hypothetical protein